MRKPLAATCLLLALAACGASGGRRRPSPTATALTEAPRTHEYPSPPAPPQRTVGAPSATVAVRAFATAYINWSYASIAVDLRRLAAASVGQARAAMTLAAAQTAGDYELRRGQVANRGAVEVVAARTGYPGQYVVVTQELTTAAATAVYQGLRPAWHVALATVARQPDGGYAVSAWEPQS